MQGADLFATSGAPVKAALAAVLICALEFTWIWLENTDADAMVLTITLLRVPAAAFAGVMAGALLGALLIRARRLFRYCKTR